MKRKESDTKSGPHLPCCLSQLQTGCRQAIFDLELPPCKSRHQDHKEYQE